MLSGILMYIHSAWRVLAVDVCHAVKLPAVALIEAVMVGKEIQHRLAERRHIAAYALQQPPRNALAAMCRLNIYGADVWPQIKPVVEIVLDNAQSADYLAVVTEHNIPAGGQRSP